MQVFRAKDYNWILSTCFCENNKYLKSFTGFSVIMCSEIVNVANSVPVNVTKKASTNLTSTACTNKFWW